ncbi:hypothetical protein E8E12_010536 [Didymella heteroderae]|uniref:CFEM domain-containing protein n=1 Tax=Didymella heteroderae TaxID=1769908 RepID=A0A9P4WX43_9PLEO|nr:hypothetical protein E8E12_010536 [Didymella heteroderae]
MKVSFLIAALLWAHIPSAAAQGAKLLQALSDLSPCAITCFTGALSTSTCTLADTNCICTSAQLQTAVEQCLLSTCSVKEGLTAQNVTATLCDQKPRDTSGELKATNIALMVVSAAFVLSRLAQKLFNPTEAHLGTDDYLIFVTLLVGQPSTILIDRGLIPNGLGRDVWTLSFEQVTAFGKYFYWIEICYFAQLSVLKLAFLFFYKRIFPGRTIQKIILVTILVNILYGIVFVAVAVFQCRPISYYWTTWDGEHTGHCININALVWANAAISIAVDFWMLGIPLSQLIHLKLSWSKKAGVIMMFCLGTFATVVSIIRLQFLITFARTKNPTWDQQNITKWSAIEIAVGVVCSCIPSIRVILVRVLPRTFGSSHDRDHRNRYHSTQGQSSKLSGFSRKHSDTGGSDKNPFTIHIASPSEYEVKRSLHTSDSQKDLAL